LRRSASTRYCSNTGRTRRAADILTNQRSRIGATQDQPAFAESDRLRRAAVFDGIRYTLPGRIAAPRAGRQRRDCQTGYTIDAINSLYFAARKAGAYGGKLLGAGGGGFLLFPVVLPTVHDAVRAAMAGLREMPFRLGVPGTTILVATGTAESQQSLR